MSYLSYVHCICVRTGLTKQIAFPRLLSFFNRCMVTVIRAELPEMNFLVAL